MSRALSPLIRRLSRKRAVVLGYHGVGECARRDDPFFLTLSPGRFRSQLETMLESGFEFVTAAELVKAADGGEPPPGLAAVTFDDGLRNNLSVAFPILSELGIAASVYVPTGWLGGTSPYVRGEQGAILTGAEVIELHNHGWEIGAHGVTHPDMAGLGYSGCVSEVRESCQTVSELIGGPVQTFAYPFGRYDEAAISAVRDSGLQGALTTGSGTWRRFEMTRAMIGAADPSLVLMLKLDDRYEPLLQNRPLQMARSLSRRLRHRLMHADHLRSAAH